MAANSTGFFSEFKTFIKRGNVIDLAVGVIMGAEFGKIVSSLVNDVIMPPLGYLINGVNFKDLQITLPQMTVPVAGVAIEPAAIKYGNFLQVTLNFALVSFCVFLLVKGINRLYRKAENEPVAPAQTPQEKLLEEIRDLLKAQSSTATLPASLQAPPRP